MWPLVKTTPPRSRVSAVLHEETAYPYTSFKVLSVWVGRDGDIDDEGGLVLDASVFAVGEGSDLHAVRVGLSKGSCCEQHSLQVLIPQGER